MKNQNKVTEWTSPGSLRMQLRHAQESRDYWKYEANVNVALRAWIAKAPHLAGCQKTTYGAKAGLAPPRCTCGRDELIGEMRAQRPIADYRGLVKRLHQNDRQMGAGREERAQ